MKSWRHAEDVVVGKVVVGPGKEIRVADYMLFGYSKSEAFQGGGVTVSTVIDGWVEDLTDVIEGGLGRIREGYLQKLVVRSISCIVLRCEQNSLYNRTCEQVQNLEAFGGLEIMGLRICLV